jgi:hypothetical protein
MSAYPSDPDICEDDHDHGDESDMIDGVEGIDWSEFADADDEAAYDGGDSGE